MISRYFYFFCAIHAFLMGLVPFFLPTLLWRQGQSLSSIALFVSLSGAAYLSCLWFWDRLRTSNYFRWAIRGSFVLESLLVISIFLTLPKVSLLFLALLNGFYSCFYWMSQRMLFKGLAADGNTGMLFGNFQIIIAVFLKVGILFGVLLLDSQFNQWLIPLSLLINLIGIIGYGFNITVTQEQQILKGKPIPIREVVFFRDRHHSKLIFFIDGLFLLLESYFWTLSLYLVSQESFKRMGFIVISLSIIMAIIFYLIKNVIDRIDNTKFYKISILFYTLSWLIRGAIHNEIGALCQNILIVFATFSTVLFRLSFNKVFFERANQHPCKGYLFFKSYYSQLGVFIIFLGFSILFNQDTNADLSLQCVYYFAALLAPFYSVYHLKNNRM